MEKTKNLSFRKGNIKCDVLIRQGNKEGKGMTFSVMGEVYKIVKHGRDECPREICGGQCLDDSYFKDMAKSNPLLKKVINLWKVYHLNEMHVGTVEQEKCVNDYFNTHKDVKQDYDSECQVLKDNNLYTVKVDGEDYKFGYGWIYLPIPKDIQNDIDNLVSDKTQVELEKMYK